MYRKFSQWKKKIIIAFMIGAIANSMAPIFASVETPPAISVAQAASCPSPTKRYQEASKDSDDRSKEATKTKDSIADNIFQSAWKILLMIAVVFAARIVWKHQQRNQNK